VPSFVVVVQAVVGSLYSEFPTVAMYFRTIVLYNKSRLMHLMLMLSVFFRVTLLSFMLSVVLI